MGGIEEETHILEGDVTESSGRAPLQRKIVVCYDSWPLFAFCMQMGPGCLCWILWRVHVFVCAPREMRVHGLFTCSPSNSGLPLLSGRSITQRLCALVHAIYRTLIHVANIRAQP